MTREDKVKTIRPWIDPKERVTVHFNDAPGLNAEITSCSERLVDLSIETPVPHMRHTISVPLNQVEISEDLGQCTRDPDRPLQRRRLILVVNDKRHPVIYE